ncbi:ABC transporter permease [Patescibacteria group bacterium]|nr:ABC transporter permease [Patescibacteria group bacterium]
MIKAFMESFKIAVTSLLSNKIQSLLTMLGIIIGVASVILIISIGAGAQSLILSEIKSLGTNLIAILPGHSEEGSFSPTNSFGVTTLKYEDALALTDNRDIPNIEAVTAYSKGFGVVEWKSETYNTTLTGTTASHLDVMGGDLEEGHFFNSEEEKRFIRIAVLGSAVRKELFGYSDAIGQKIKINDYVFEVIGVMKERGNVILEDYDDQIFIPLRTAQRILGVNYVGLIRVKVTSEEDIYQVEENIKTILREQHDIKNRKGENDDFMVQNIAKALDMITEITNSLRYFLAIMAGLSLVVGGIGIMNIMLISVTERTREIGLRKAVGAKSLHVLGQFLMEAIFVTVIGGVTGIILGIILSILIATGAHLLGYDWDFIISLNSIFLALGVSAGVGLFFGFYPAVKASKLDPITALRYE